MAEEENIEETAPVEEQETTEQETQEEELDYNAIADEIEKLRKENTELKKQSENFKKKEEDGRERLKRILMGREQAKTEDIEPDPAPQPTPSEPQGIPEDYFTKPIEF